MTNLVSNNLLRNEIVIASAKINSLCLLVPILFMAFVVLVFILSAIAGGIVGMIAGVYLLIIGIALFVVAFLRYKNIVLSITNKRIIGKNGVLSVKATEAPLKKIQSVSINQTAFGRLLNYGTIIIDTAACTAKFSSPLTFHYVKNPKEIQNCIFNQLFQYDENMMSLQAEKIARIINPGIRTSTPQNHTTQQNINQKFTQPPNPTRNPYPYYTVNQNPDKKPNNTAP